MKNHSFDSFEKVKNPPKETLWGEQTQRSLHYFNNGYHHFSPVFIDALVSIRKPVR